MRRHKGRALPSRNLESPFSSLLSLLYSLVCCFVSDLKSFHKGVTLRSLIRPVNPLETRAPAFYFFCFPLPLAETRILLSTWRSLNRSCWLSDLGDLVNRLVRSPSVSCVKWHSLVVVPVWLTGWCRQSKRKHKGQVCQGQFSQESQATSS